MLGKSIRLFSLFPLLVKRINNADVLTA